ncbi:TPA: hypothetical protein ACMDTO_000145 [Vibrio cholerae]|uniref:hypothetical protein n=1 Tax=Vibrio cholerae TaxID=666 RepID=UPI001DBE9CB6|nr:hypothetical protein [Vibrio cholerae]EGR4280981.1 hypothetical protein [Vibrio cholerae]
MNGRQFKKLCKRAAAVMIKIQPQFESQLFFSEERGGEPEITRHYKWDVNTLRQNWRWKGDRDAMPDSLPKGIAGFGCWDGYYEPEWDDEDALSTLMHYVCETFTDSGSFDGNSWPENNCPEKLLRLPNKAIKYAELNLIKEAA